MMNIVRESERKNWAQEQKGGEKKSVVYSLKEKQISSEHLIKSCVLAKLKIRKMLEEKYRSKNVF